MKKYAIILNSNRIMTELIQKRLFEHGFRWYKGQDIKHNYTVLFLNTETSGEILGGDWQDIEDDEIQYEVNYIYSRVHTLDGVSIPTEEITIEEIAKKFNIPVDKVRIKK
jgi:hypothetical protein